MEWTKEKVSVEAKNYKKRSEFQKKARGAYNAALKNGWLDTICTHMPTPQKPKGFWTLEKVLAEAGKHQTFDQFRKNGKGAYKSACKQGWLEQVKEIVKPAIRRGKWTDEAVLAAARSCKTRTEFNTKYGGAYNAAVKKGLLPKVQEILKDMRDEGRKKTLIWTKDKIAEVAKQYKTRNEFQYSKKHSGAYRRAQRTGILDDVCSHMKRQDHGYLHCVYVIKNERLNKAYIGITRQKFGNRVEQHKSQDNKTASKQISLLPDTEFIQLTDYLFKSDDMKVTETQYYNQYKDQGYTVINTESALGTVGTRDAFWTLKTCKEKALEYETRTAFARGSSGAYDAAQKNGWLDEIYQHMEVKKRPKGYWTIEKVQEEASKFETRGEFKDNSGAAWDFAFRQGWMDKVCAHMREVKKQKGYWTYERVKEIALKFEVSGDFNRAEPLAYAAALNHNWFDDVTAHMRKHKARNFWTFKKVRAEALKFKTRKEFQTKEGSAYKKAQTEGWLDDVCAHMKTPAEIRDEYWTKDRVIEAARKCTTKKEFQKSNSYAYNKARRNDWLDETYAHMSIIKRNYKSQWDKESVKKEALKYTYRVEFQKKSGGAYSRARKENWLDEVCVHMNKETTSSGHKKPGYWTLERIQEEANKYKTRGEFSDQSASAYQIARSKAWLDKVCDHMVETKKPQGYWTKEKVQIEANKYTTTGEFSRNAPLACKAAKRNGWYEELSAHMDLSVKPAGYWNNIENVSKEAKKYPTRMAFKKGSGSAYKVATKHGWLDEVCGHMIRK